MADKGNNGNDYDKDEDLEQQHGNVPSLLRPMSSQDLGMSSCSAATAGTGPACSASRVQFQEQAGKEYGTQAGAAGTGGGGAAADNGRSLIHAGFPPSFEALKSQISEDRERAASGDVGVVGPISSTKFAQIGSPSFASFYGTTPEERRSRAAYKRALYETMGEYTALTKLPKEQDDTNIMPLFRVYDFLFYFRALLCPKGQTISEAFERAVYKPLAGIVWFISLIWWQVLLGVIIAAFALVFVQQNDKVNWDTDAKGYLTDYKNTHRNFGAILGFVIGFRVNIAYQSYIECRRVVSSLMASIREIVLEAYSTMPKGYPGPAFADTGEVVPGGPSKVDANVLAAEVRYLKETSREIRRLCMLMLAFIRQDVREKRYGFLRGTDLEDMPFQPYKNFFLDPVRPRLWDILTEEELLEYSTIHPRARPGVVAGRMKAHLEGMCYRSEKGASVFYRVVMPQVQNVLLGHETLVRLRDTPLPYPFNYVLQISTFAFVYSTPFFYHTDEVGTFLCVQFMILIYYGLLRIAVQIEFPCRYTHGGFSVSLEKYCHRIHSDCLQYAKALADDTKSFIPAYLEKVEK
jgi:predicted membrane chloride channel (bestrophin family)